MQPCLGNLHFFPIIKGNFLSHFRQRNYCYSLNKGPCTSLASAYQLFSQEQTCHCFILSKHQYESLTLNLSLRGIMVLSLMSGCQGISNADPSCVLLYPKSKLMLDCIVPLYLIVVSVDHVPTLMSVLGTCLMKEIIT